MFNHDSALTETFAPIQHRVLVLGHGGHGKGTLCRMLYKEYGERSLSSSEAAWPYIWPAFNEATRRKYATPEIGYENRRQHRMLCKRLISLLNTPDKTTLSKLILSQVPIYDGMRDADEYADSEHLFTLKIWVDAMGREGTFRDPSMQITCPREAIIVENNEGLPELAKKVQNLAKYFTTE